MRLPLPFVRVLGACALAACGTTPDPVPPPDPLPKPNALSGVTAWVCQLQGIEVPGAVDRLARSRADLVVMEAMVTVKGREGFPIRPVVAQVRASPGEATERKVCVAYVSVGQAESYRRYWGEGWREGASGSRGSPEFLLSGDADGWAGNNLVAYWDPRWRDVLWGSPEALVDQVLAAGFDGVFLDWVLAFREPDVRKAAEEDGVDAAAEMVALVSGLRDYARTRHPGFVVIALSGAPLAQVAPELFDHVDGVCQESLSFHGKPSGDWDAPENRDLRTPPVGDWSTQSLAAMLAPFVGRGIPVFTLDYASEPANVEAAERTSRGHGFVPFVSRTSLSRLPDRVVGD